jgi:superfamily II DNA/RNA helicase
LNILSRLDLSSEQLQKTPQALILAPTRELARQIVGVIQVMGQFLDGLVIGTAVPADTNARPTKLECSVVVGTPGTVMDMIKKRVMVAAKLKVLVLDEADNMLDQQGLGDQCIRVKALVSAHSLVFDISITCMQLVTKRHSSRAFLRNFPCPRPPICFEIRAYGQRTYAAA